MFLSNRCTVKKNQEDVFIFREFKRACHFNHNHPKDAEHFDRDYNFDDGDDDGNDGVE